jgi:hypothetical protein
MQQTLNFFHASHPITRRNILWQALDSVEEEPVGLFHNNAYAREVFCFILLCQKWYYLGWTCGFLCKIYVKQGILYEYEKGCLKERSSGYF